MASLQETAVACQNALRQEAPRIVLLQAQTALALVTLRIQNQGLGAYQYSATPVPVFFFAKRALNAAGRAYVQTKQKAKAPRDRLGTWGEFRAAQGLPSSMVTLTYTGGMFRSLTVVAAGASGAVYQAKIVAADRESAAKVAYNQARYGDFLAPLATEAAEVAQVGQVEINKVLNQYFPQA